jgi:hypothetical protein
MPNRAALLAAYQAAIHQIEGERGRDYSKGFHADIADSVFEHGWQALTDVCRAPQRSRMHVVSAPVGSGKTTFGKAFAVALTRVSEAMPNGPHGSLFLVEQITKADDLYREFEAMLPGKVAIWTTNHDKDSTPKPDDVRVANPAARFSAQELSDYPVVITTHKFYKGKRGAKACEVWKGGVKQRRALTIVDEKPEDTTVFDISLSDAEAVREAIQSDDAFSAPCRQSIRELCLFMEPRSHEGPSLETPNSPNSTSEWAKAAKRLEWFKGKEAQELSRHTRDSRLAFVFGFGKAVAEDFAFITRARGGGVRYIGYETHLTLTPGMLLLDATADIDGVTQLCPWRKHGKMPQPSYHRLEIVRCDPHTKKRLTPYLKLAKNQRAYVRWMVDIIKQNMAPGQKGLVVCRKQLFDDERVPNWPEGDPRFNAPESFSKEFAWEIDGRLLCATHWGSGVGFNDWRDADVVFLFDEFILPKGVAAATAQGLQRLKASQGELGRMKAINSKAPAVNAIWEGHTLRWLKQMALRGKAREFDEKGVCGKQKLVVTGDRHRLLSNLHLLFPGAKAPSLSNHEQANDDTNYQKLLTFLSQRELPSIVPIKTISRALGVEWRDVGKNFIKRPDVTLALANIGWAYRPVRGRGGSSFVRLTADTSRAAA